MGANDLKSTTLALAMLMLAACTPGLPVGTNKPQDSIMTPQTTHLYLLKDTPFFTALTRPQLRWVIDHSHEWGAEPGTVVVNHDACAAASDAIWVLLDGAWLVETKGKQFPAGHADPGKWFSAADAGGNCRLIVTEKSYVMKIERADMDEMLTKGFAFVRHLDAGKTYYRAMF